MCCSIRNFLESSPKLKKKKNQRHKAIEKRRLNEAPEEKTKESKKLKEEETPNLKKIKFGRRVIEDAKSVRNSDKETNSRTILTSKIPISL